MSVGVRGYLPKPRAQGPRARLVKIRGGTKRSLLRVPEVWQNGLKRFGKPGPAVVVISTSLPAPNLTQRVANLSIARSRVNNRSGKRIASRGRAACPDFISC